MRIGYRLNPRSLEDLRRGLETATAQWGGTLHPLIPVFARRPPWWTLEPWGSAAARTIEESYLQAFACDFVVDARAGVTEPAPRFGSITFSELRRDEGETKIAAGLPAAAVYRQLWNDEFRWQARRPADVVVPVAARAGMELFVGACFGCFAADGDLSQFESEYRRAFEAETVPIAAANFLDGLASVAPAAYLTPLSVSHHGLRIGRLGWVNVPTVLLVDHEEPADVVDLWNLRASGQRTIPLPLCWAQELLQDLASRLAEQPPSAVTGPEVRVMGAHRVAEDRVRDTAQRLRGFGVDAVISRYPAPGRDLRYAWAAAVDDSIEATVRDGRLEIPLPEPAAAKHYPWGPYRWTVALDYQPWTLPHDGTIGALVPDGLGELSGLLGAWSHLELRASREGWLLPTGAQDDRLSMRPPSGRTILAAILSIDGSTPRASDPGKVADQLIRQLGGLEGVGLVQAETLMQLFNQAASGAMAPDDDRPDRRRPSVRFIPWARLHAEINRTHADNAPARGNLMRELVARGVLRSGLQLNCPHCDFANWVELGGIAHELQCERCLADFPFPQDDPPKRDQWAYRPAGAFSVEGYAHGGYTVAYALRFLTERRGRASWSTGLQLNQDTEVDFSLIREDERDWNEEGPFLLLGEAKSYGRFEARDFERARQLGERFPRATLVFATLRPSLSEYEKGEIQGLAHPSVKRYQDLPMHAPVMVLTALELFHPEGPPGCWKDAGGHAAQLSAQADSYVRPRVPTWADLTLQLHAGLEPHHQWWEAEALRLRR